MFLVVPNNRRHGRIEQVQVQDVCQRGGRNGLFSSVLARPESNKDFPAELESFIRRNWTYYAEDPDRGFDSLDAESVISRVNQYELEQFIYIENRKHQIWNHSCR